MSRVIASLLGLLLLAAATVAGAETPSDGTQEHEATWLLAYGSPHPGCNGTITRVPALEPAEDVWYARMDVDPATWGASFTLAVTTSHDDEPYEITFTLPGVGVAFFDADGLPTGWALEYGPARIADGTVPASAATAVFFSCEDVGPFNATYQAGSDG